MCWGYKIAEQIAILNDNVWRSFFELLKVKKEGRLPPFIKRISPPGYWKNRDSGERVKIIAVKAEKYIVRPENSGEGTIEIIIARGRKLEIRYAGKLRWAGRQGRMLIVKEAGRWFAYIPVEVGEVPGGYKKGYIRGKRIKIRQREPRGEEAAFIDMGLNNLFAIVTTTGDASLVKRGAVKAEHYREKKEIRAMQSTRNLLRNKGLEIWRRFHERYLRAYFKWHERLRHLYSTATRFTAEWLHVRGVRKVYLGYPYMIT